MKSFRTIFFLFLLSGLNSLQAQIETVQLFVGSASATELEKSKVHNVSAGRVQGFRVPFVTGKDHIVHLVGNWLDVSDRVEIVKDGKVSRTISKSAYLLANTSGGKGQIRFKVNSSDLPTVGGSFTIRVRWIVETNGFQKLDGKTVARGTVSSIKWVGGTGITMPECQPNTSSGEVCRLPLNNLFKLELNGSGFSTNTQVFDGITEKIFQTSTGLGFEVSDAVATSSRVTLTFSSGGTGSSWSLGTNNTSSLPMSFLQIADGGAGNIAGGWGRYVYYRVADNLSITGDLTNLKSVVASNTPLSQSSGGSTGGSTGGGTGGTVTLPPPPALPDLRATGVNQNFVCRDGGNVGDGTFTYHALNQNFCSALGQNGFTQSGAIPANFGAASGTPILKLTHSLPNTLFGVKNMGTAPTGSGFTVQIFKGSSTTPVVTSNVGALAINGTANVTLPGTSRGTIDVYRFPGFDGTDNRYCYVRQELNNSLPAALEDNGYKIKLDSGSAVNEGTTGESNNTKTFNCGTTVVILGN